MTENKTSQVAEFQGLYGPFTVSERVLQRIWLRGDFDGARLRLTDGRAVRVLSPGRWNLLAGPDFLGADLVIGDRPAHGDVEVHFHAADWRAHGHGDDPAYDRVVLHVVLFPPPAGAAVARDLPVLPLLPVLNRDLEECAADDALEQLTARDEARRFADLAARPAAQRLALLHGHARARWDRKVRQARARIERLGWTAAAHHAALEILGYRHNRVPMLALATRRPLAEWGIAEAAESFYAEQSGWCRHGVRPANHPLRRLRQYAGWVAARPDWPDRLAALARVLPENLPGAGEPDATRRARRQLAAWQAAAGAELSGGRLRGTRAGTWLGDGALPLGAALTGREAYAAWFHGQPGDQPARIARILRQLEISGRPAQPHCQGLAQGLLGWLIEHDGCT